MSIDRKKITWMKHVENWFKSFCASAEFWRQMPFTLTILIEFCLDFSKILTSSSTAESWERVPSAETTVNSETSIRQIWESISEVSSVTVSLSDLLIVKESESPHLASILHLVLWRWSGNVLTTAFSFLETFLQLVMSFGGRYVRTFRRTSVGKLFREHWNKNWLHFPRSFVHCSMLLFGAKVLNIPPQLSVGALFR